MATKAFSYLRVSGLGQIDGDGFARQREAIARYAKAHRIELLDEFRDEGVSGTTEWDAREGLTALCKRLDANGVRLVLVERADRIARDLMVSEVLLEQFRKRGVRVIEVEGGNDLSDDAEPTRTLVRQVLAAIHQFEKRCLVAKLRAARDRIRSKTGRCEGPLPYGSDPERPLEASTLARMKELKARRPRLSLQTIADQLNTEPAKYPTRTGKPWTKITVWQTLQKHGGSKV